MILQLVLSFSLLALCCTTLLTIKKEGYQAFFLLQWLYHRTFHFSQVSCKRIESHTAQILIQSLPIVIIKNRGHLWTPESESCYDRTVALSAFSSSEIYLLNLEFLFSLLSALKSEHRTDSSNPWKRLHRLLFPLHPSAIVGPEPISSFLCTSIVLCSIHFYR